MKRNRRKKKVIGTAERPRLVVYKSLKHIYCQVVNDIEGVSLAAASTLEKGVSFPKEGGKVAKAKIVGELLAERCLAKDIEKVVFDRNGFMFHGRVKALADAAREKGLKF